MLRIATMGRDLETRQAGPGRRPAARHRHRCRPRRHPLPGRQSADRCRAARGAHRVAVGDAVRSGCRLLPAHGNRPRADLDHQHHARCSISRRWWRSLPRRAAVNDIAIASITLGRPVAVDTFADNQPTGAFLIVDAVTGATVAGGVVTTATKRRCRQRLGLQADARIARARPVPRSRRQRRGPPRVPAARQRGGAAPARRRHSRKDRALTLSHFC